MTKFKSIMLAAIGVAMAATATAGAASAETRFQAHHPRRVEVNHRLAVENARIHEARREGRITPHKAAILHARVHAIRKEERIDARLDKSHITRGEQRALNRQENGVNRALNR
jgi:hypothetical protein